MSTTSLYQLQWNGSTEGSPFSTQFEQNLSSSLSYSEVSFSSSYTNNTYNNIQAGYYFNWKTTGPLTTYFLYDYENEIVGTGTSPNSPYNPTTFSFTTDVRLKDYQIIVDVSGYGPTVFNLDDFTVSIPVFVLISDVVSPTFLPSISSNTIYQSFLNDPVNVYNNDSPPTLVGTVTFILNAAFYICNYETINSAVLAVLSTQNNLTYYNNNSIQAGPLAISTNITNLTYTPTPTPM